jgi:hypothetical protein
MGQQQLLLIILGVIIVGIAIAVGLQLFQAGSVGANQDAIVNDVMNIAAHADQFRIRPVSMGGGGGVFDSYTVPSRLLETGNGRVTGQSGAGNTFSVTMESVSYPGSSVQLTYIPDPSADEATAQENQYTWTFTGLFE